MAIYSCRVQTISRAKGRSATAAAAYRSGTSIEDVRTGEIHNYTNRSGVETTGIVLPDSSPNEFYNRDNLWNAAEQAEKRKNSTVAREVLVAVPHELDIESRNELIQGYAQYLSNRYKTGVDFAIHEPDAQGDNRNYHAHILMTTRRVDEQGFGAKTRELDEIRGDNPRGKLEVNNIRQTWEEHANEALERSGKEERIDSRSLKDQGIDRLPTVHIGPSGNALDRKKEFSERAELNREIKELNKQRIQVLRELKELHNDKREINDELSELYGTRKEVSSDLKKTERLKNAVAYVRENSDNTLKELELNHSKYKRWHDKQIQNAVGEYQSFTKSEPVKRKWFERKETFDKRREAFELEKEKKFTSMQETISEHKHPTLSDAISKESSKAAFEHKIKKTEIENNVNVDFEGQLETKNKHYEAIQKQISESSSNRSDINDQIKLNRNLLSEIETKTQTTQKKLDLNTTSIKGGKMSQEEMKQDNLQEKMDAASKQESEYYKGVREKQYSESKEAIEGHHKHFEKIEKNDNGDIDLTVSPERKEIDSMLKKSEERKSESSKEKDEEVGY